MKGDSRGSMPFAVVAVTLLVLSVACGAVMAGYDRASGNADSIGQEADAMDRAAAGIARHIERGLGEVVLSVSRDADIGGMDDRRAAFSERADDWFGFQFPVADSGVRAVSEEHSLELGAVSMADAAGPDRGQFPAYLRCTGTVKVVLESEDGRAVRELEVCSDGSCALPLAAGQGSLFENAAGGKGFGISQMMEYQLSCLAQSRVISGYGSDNSRPGMGTGDIITASDVREAYGNSLMALSLVCFRDCGDDVVGCRGVDLADALVSEDGFLEIDMDAFFAQSLFSCLDSVALGWFEYFSGDRVAESKLSSFVGLLAVGRAVKDVLLGNSVFGAQSYITEAMSRGGYSGTEWNRPGSGTTSGTVMGITITVGNPTEDLLTQDWIRFFKIQHDFGGNYVLDSMRDVLRTAASVVAERTGAETLRVPLDPTDSETFAETLSEAFSAGRERMLGTFQGIMDVTLDRPCIVDPFCVEISDKIASKSRVFYRTADFEEALRAELERTFPPGDGPSVDELMGSEECRAMVLSYEHAVERDLDRFDVLRHQPGETNIIEDLAAGIISVGMHGLGLLAPVERTMDDIVGEMCESVSMNPRAGIEELPGTDGFRLVDRYGNRTTEHIEVAGMHSDPVVSVSVDGDRSMHNIGFDADGAASFTTVFRVSVRDRVDYALTGSSALSQSLGTDTSSFRGQFGNDLLIEVPVVSGWALDGVGYRPSTTLGDDVMDRLLILLEPILEPLRQAVSAMRLALDLVIGKAAEIGRYVASELAEMYVRAMEPVFRLQEWIQSHLESLFDETGMEIYNSISRKVQATEVSVYGFVLRVQTDVGSWFGNTKSLLRVSLSGIVSGLDFTAGLDFRCRGEIRAENMGVSGFGSLEGDGWRVKGTLDPLMKFSRHALSVTGWTPDNKVSLVMPELEDHHLVDIRLSDDPVVGGMLSNIPLPLIGAKAGIDAGFEVRYADPVKRGLLINEFESNPEGRVDTGNEWVEIMNNSPVPADLSGYTLSASSDWRTKTMTLSGTLGPGEYAVVYPDFVLVNEKGKHTKNGEALTLKDPAGDTVDKTPTLRDTANDAGTWHRVKDGAMEWTFGKATQGASNGGRLDGTLTREDAVSIAAEAVDRAFDDVPLIDDTGTCTEFLKSLVHHTLDLLIDRVTGSVIDASVFAEAELSDAAGAAKGGTRIALRADGGLAEDVLRYMAGKLEELLLNVENPYGIDPLGMFTENIGLETTFKAGIGLPDVFGKILPEETRMDLGVTFRTNAAALTHLFGNGTGRPEVVCGVRIPDCPLLLVPERLHPDAEMTHDLWLMRLTVRWP